MKASNKRKPIGPGERLCVIICDYVFDIWLLVNLKVPSHLAKLQLVESLKKGALETV